MLFCVELERWGWCWCDEDASECFSEFLCELFVEAAADADEELVALLLLLLLRELLLWA